MTNTANCSTCQTGSATCNLTDGRTLCVSCWNTEAEAGRVARKAELAAARAARKAAPRMVAMSDAGGWSAAAQLSRLAR